MTEYEMQMITALLGIIGSVLGFIGWVLASVGHSIAQKFGQMTNSVDTLNIKIAVVIEKLENHDKRIEKLEGDK